MALIRSLGDKRNREEAGLFVVEGRKSVEEFEGSNFKIRKIYYNERVSHLKTPTDQLALVELPQWKFDAEGLKGKLVLALDEVQNPGNVGTIIRLADWFGIDDILCSQGTADCFGPKVVQATMGALTRVRVHYGNLGEMIEVAVAAAGPDKVPVYGAFLEGESIYEAELEREGIVVLGSEGRGISEEVEKLVARRIFIPPTRAGSESLNVATAAAIIISKLRNP